MTERIKSTLHLLTAREMIDLATAKYVEEHGMIKIVLYLFPHVPDQNGTLVRKDENGISAGVMVPVSVASESTLIFPLQAVDAECFSRKASDVFWEPVLTVCTTKERHMKPYNSSNVFPSGNTNLTIPARFEEDKEWSVKLVYKDDLLYAAKVAYDPALMPGLAKLVTRTLIDQEFLIFLDIATHTNCLMANSKD